MNWLCDSFPWASKLCDPTFPWLEVLVGAVVSILFTWFIAAPRKFPSLIKPRYWKFYGRWHRYWLGFYRASDEEEYSVYRGTVTVLPSLVGAPFAYCSNKIYPYWGRFELLNSSLYIDWSGWRHPEHMLSVYQEPLRVSESTILVGVNAGITGRGDPAANVELMTKKPMSNKAVRVAVSKPAIVITEAIISDERYD